MLFEILLRKNFWIRLNPRFSVLRRNRENSPKIPPFCFTTEFEENGSSGCCDVYPGRSNNSRPLISMVQYTFEKCADMPSRSAIGCCSNIPDLKKDILYNLLAVIGQWYNKDITMVDFVEPKHANWVCENHWRTLTGICSADFQTLFSKFSAQSQPAICRNTIDNLYLPVPQYL